MTSLRQGPLTVPLRRIGVGWGTIGFWICVIGAWAALGMFYTAIRRHGSILNSAVYGECCGAGVMLFEQGLLFASLRTKVRHLPWLFGVVATAAIYLALIMVGATVAGLALDGLHLLVEPIADAVVLGPTTTLYALIVLGFMTILIRMRDLIGAGAFRNILMGRYHQPVEEERIFVFLDLVGSTSYAHRYGDLAAQAYLGAIFGALAEPVRRHGGSIDDYVGDMALITWPMKAGARDGRCIACVFAFLDVIEKRAESWRREFGEVPAFRAALHGGSIVTAEIGVDHCKISYFGDVVNTTGRIEALCRELEAPLLISADLLDRIPGLPHGVVALSRGAHAVKGRGQALDVLSLQVAA